MVIPLEYVHIYHYKIFEWFENYGNVFFLNITDDYLEEYILEVDL